ncbi:MAG: hypothetical protein Q8L78_04395 [Coxiellaceae bacterium]|nr:hypothetical protein [Coxiellaceae bacterium]
MVNLKNILILCLFLYFIAPASVFAGQSNDFVEYYSVLREAGSAPNTQSQFGKWTDSDTGSCPGISFPKTIDINASSPDPTTPNPQNEIKIDPKSVAFPYNCYTTYTASVYKNSQPTGTTASCTVGVKLIMQGDVVEGANLLIQSGSYCHTDASYEGIVHPARDIILENIYSS